MARGAFDNSYLRLDDIKIEADGVSFLLFRRFALATGLQDPRRRRVFFNYYLLLFFFFFCVHGC
jgi:hypothetical protein